MFTLADRIHEEMWRARKDGKKAILSILSVLLGEVQNFKNSQRHEITDEQVVQIVKRLIASNDETLTQLERKTGNDRFNRLHLENIVLESFLPHTWSPQQIEDYLRKKSSIILSPRTPGQAIGIAIKLLNSNQCPVDNNDVAEVVKKIRDGIR